MGDVKQKYRHMLCNTTVGMPTLLPDSAGSRRNPFREIPVTKVLWSAGLRRCTPLPQRHQHKVQVREGWGYRDLWGVDCVSFSVFKL